VPRHATRRALLLVSAAVVVLAALFVPATAPADPDGAGPGFLPPAAAALAATGTAAATTAAATTAATGAARRSRRPNIVVVMTDDMAATDLQHMPRTRRLVGRRGVRFDRATSSNPMCCPARAAFLTGQESHNSGVLSNGGPRGGYQALSPGRLLPEWLRSAGYFTAFVGKHLNGYRPDRSGVVERGWTMHDPILKGLYNYRSYLTWNNGRPRRHRGYVTSYITDRSTRIVRAFDRRRDSRPFFLWAGDVAPHNAFRPGCGCYGDPIPQKRDLGTMSGARSVSRRSLAYDQPNGVDKPPFMRELPPLDRAEVDTTFQRRIESLKAVDRQVGQIMAALREGGELRRTVVVFTSDNGYMLGQHRYVGKRLPYQPSVRVPLLIRGPGVARGARNDSQVSTTDLTATVLDLAGATPTRQLDGVSFRQGLRDPDARPARTAAIVQTGAAAEREGDTPTPGESDDLLGWLHRGYQDSRYSYSHYPSKQGWPAFEELYDRTRDPAEVHNVIDDPAYRDVVREVRQRAAELRLCAGSSCHPTWPPLPDPS